MYGECNCFEKFYMDDTGTCQSCKPPCFTCTTLTNCLSCIEGMIFSGTGCDCQKGYFKDDHQLCQPCRKPCLECYSVQNCITCMENMDKKVVKLNCIDCNSS